MMRHAIAAMSACCLGLWIGATAADSIKSKNANKKQVNLTAETNWGYLEQKGDSIVIAGPNWLAVGSVRNDGTVYLQWIENRTGKPAHAVYRIDGTKLVGVWGWADQCEVLPSGALEGTLMGDTTYPVKEK